VDLFSSLIYGFGLALQPSNLLFCFIGVFLGTLVGVLPGIGPVGTIALLLPLTFKLSPVTGIIMLAGIYYGSMYGGSTTSILINIPGETSSVVTCLDGYQMALRGRAGPALGIAAFGSFIAGSVGLAGLVLIANPLADLAVKFGPAEYFSLLCLGLVALTFLSQGSVLRGLSMASLGLFLSLIGQDVVTGTIRFSFGLVRLEGGLDLVPVMMGLFGISEVLLNVERLGDERHIVKAEITNLLPSKSDWRQSALPIARGTILGFFLGLLPGGGAIMSSFFSYTVEKKLSRHPENFGQGAIEGVAGPESANNSATSAAFIPLFSLGIPGTMTTAILLGAFIIHGVQPGPMLLSQHPEIFWGTVASMYVGNVLLLVLNLPLIGMWVQLLRVPYRTLFPLILFFCLVGAFSGSMDTAGIYLMLIFGIVGYVLRKLNYEPAPLVLAFVLGPMFERNLRQALIISDGSPMVFLTHPISLGALVICFLFLFSAILPSLRRKRRLALSDKQ
jgi:putative tricarboxylic transport membrane protein